ncbi:hypothetical protein PVBG_04759 [Plasmodium vivax Brazil I]|uniref:Variable surface protein Vir7-like protein n=1 Tax=Plasmodium vivax (strain Brazil I) TaxID=1033975 RepID=A0A0J9SZI7_PLAV1|nr:hypothetical protein PVBG_04759 [Plasmodium vivax Brazil I]
MASLDDLTKKHTVSCQSTIQNYLQSNTQYVDICKVLKSSLIFFSMFSVGHDNNTYCAYINHWLNDQLKKITHSTSDTNSFYSTIINNDTDNYSKLNVCQGKIYHMVDEEFNNINTLNNLYEQFNEFRTKVGRDGTHDASCVNAIEFSNLYNNLISKCIPDESINLCNELKNVITTYQSGKWIIGQNVCKHVPHLLSLEAYKEKINQISTLTGENDSITLKQIIVISAVILGVFISVLIVYKVNTYNNLY